MGNSRWTTGRLLACAAVAGLAVMTTACTSESGSDESGDTSNAVGQSGLSEATAEVAAAQVGDISATDLVIDDRKLIKTGTVELESNDVDKLLGQLDGVVTAQQGLVDSEDVRTDDDGDAKSATILVRVPVDRFEAAVDDIADLGELVREQTSSEDVTTRVAESTPGSRVRSGRSPSCRCFSTEPSGSAT